MKNIRHFLAMFSLIASIVAANAQTAFQAKFQLTSETRWGRAVLPAGEYILTVNSVQSPIILQSVDGKGAGLVMAQSSVDPAPGDSYILITGSGSDRMVRSVNLPPWHRAFLFKPVSEREQETLYAHASEMVPVQIAKK